MNDLTKRLSAIIKRQLKKGHTSVSYAIMRHGEIMAADSIGYSDQKEKTPADLRCTYNVASVSKIYCTVAVMQLVERGKLSLDEPVCSYLPKLDMPLDPRFRKITLRHCLNHSSGLPGTQWRGFSVSTLEGADYYADVYDYLSKSTLKAEPGAYSVYCNDGFTLAEMAVAEVSGMPYARYCMENITEPISAHSTRLSSMLNPEYTLVKEGERPPELLHIQGGAGITTTMSDLCAFGNTFLHDSPLLSRKSMDEMASPQGRTFLKTDEKSPLYGLGWDTVDYRDADFDLGDGVLSKGGNSFQFDTQFLIIPKYDAVLAISETHDCGLNINALIMRMFATMLLEEGENIYTRYKPVPKDIIKKYSGVYLTPGCAFTLHMEGAAADAARLDVYGEGGCIWHDMMWTGKEFERRSDEQDFLFDGDGEDDFIMTRYRTRVSGCAMKAKDFPALPEAWTKRLGKKYLPCTLDLSDEVIFDIMSGFRIERLPGFDGLMLFSFSGRPDSGDYGFFESTLRPVDDLRAIGILRTPTNPSRDLVDPIFYVKDGVEYCDVASYTYRDAASLEEYSGQPFPIAPRENTVCRITSELAALPDIPAGHRLMLLGEDMMAVYDSMFSKEYAPVKEGYIVLI